MSRILVAEDDIHTLRVISVWLAQHGHEVIEAPDGCVALDLIRTAAPDVLITDVNMPGMDGLELIRQVRASGTRLLGIIVLTNRCDHSEIADGLEGLDVTLMAKPFSPRKLIQQVQTLLDGSSEDRVDEAASSRSARSVP